MIWQQNSIDHHEDQLVSHRGNWRDILQRFLPFSLKAVHVCLSDTPGRAGFLAGTDGADIFVSPAAFELPPRDLLWLLAHEGWHIHQVRQGAVNQFDSLPNGPHENANLEWEANLFADVVTVLMENGFAAGEVCDLVGTMAFANPRGAYLPGGTFVPGSSGLPDSIDGWVERFRSFGRNEREIRPILEQLAGVNSEFKSEAELAYVVRATMNEARRPRVGGKLLTIGIPFRDDQRGGAIIADATLVAHGTAANVLVLIPHDVNQDYVDQMLDAGVDCIKMRPDQSVSDLGVDAVYVSGGPYDHPNAQNPADGRPTRPRAARGAARADAAQERHNFESAIIQGAVAGNVPILGVCGGSWRVAAELGATIERLPHDVARVHAGPMNQPHGHRHDVAIQPVSMLDQIMRTDNYRNGFLDDRVARAGDEGMLVPVNSVHWAQSTFPALGDTTMVVHKASHEGAEQNVTEAWEMPQMPVAGVMQQTLHFAIGIQWHPEYAQLGLEGCEPAESQKHERILLALGDAARDGKAARILQGAAREFLERKRAERAAQQAAPPAEMAASASSSDADSSGDGGAPPSETKESE